MALAVSSLVEALTALATGASLTAVTVIVPVAVLLFKDPSLALYVKVSVPFQLESGVYVNVEPEILVDPLETSLTIE